jgi:leucyl-tRNA synthetase
MLYKNAIKSGFYDFTSARDAYRESTKAAGIGMHHSVARQYIELQALLITPIAPHWAEYIWLEVLQKSDTVQRARWPDVATADPGLTAARNYIRSTVSGITSAEAAQQKRLAKGKSATYDPNAPKIITIFFAKSFPAWQDHCIELVRDSFSKLGVVDIQNISKGIDKKEMKRAMPFVQGFKKRLEAGESSSEVFDRKLPFDEEAVLNEIVPAIKQAVKKCQDVVVLPLEAGNQGEALPPGAENAVPGSPAFYFKNA